MTDFDYKKYSLEKLEDWMHDAMSCDETTPQDIFDVIKGVVEENYYHHKHHASQAHELLSLLNGHNSVDFNKEYLHIDPAGNDLSDVDGLYMTQFYCDSDDSSEECKSSWNSFWDDDDVIKEDKVVKWQLPVDMDPSGEYFITFPDDLLEAAGLEEGDNVEWVDNQNGSYTLRKTNAK